MNSDFEKIEKSKAVLQKIAGGVNPLNDQPIEKDSILNDTRIIRCFYLAAEILDNVVKGVYSRNYNRLEKFFITDEQRSKVQFTDGKIGVNEFSKCVNACIDFTKSKRLTGVELNRKLKKLGILNEESIADGKTRTVINENSIKYGLESERKSYNGVEYDMVVINDDGKNYLLKNIEEIMSAG